MKRVTIASLICAILFGILATWLGPRMIAYWYAPPVPSGAASAFNCTDAVSWAMHKLVLTQLIGTAIGLVVGIVIGIVMRRKKPDEPVATVATPGTTTTPPKA